MPYVGEVCFVGFSLRGFSLGTPVFPFSQKSPFLNFNYTRIVRRKTSISLFFLFFFFFFYYYHQSSAYFYSQIKSSVPPKILLMNCLFEK